MIKQVSEYSEPSDWADYVEENKEENVLIDEDPSDYGEIKVPLSLLILNRKNIQYIQYRQQKRV